MSRRSSGTTYSTLKEAAAAALALGIETCIEYNFRYKEDPLLPACPNQYYSDWSGWRDFFGKPENKHYESVREASEATIALGIRTITEYENRYKEDPKLPSNPHRAYRSEWPGYPAFFGKKTCSFFKSYEEARAAAIALNIKSYAEYRKRYREHPQLPANPRTRYFSEWIDWKTFLGVKIKSDYYSYAEARRVAQQSGVSRQSEYQSLARMDRRLPSNPNKVYQSEWVGWRSFLAPIKPRLYESYNEAKAAVRAIGLANSQEYLLRYKEDPKLPAHPEKKYSDEWSSWRDFLGPKAIKRAEQFAREGNSFRRQIRNKSRKLKPHYKSFDEAAKAARALGIKTRKSYGKSYFADPRLRANPNQIYKSSWRGWDFFLTGNDTSRYPTYAEAQKAARSLKICTAREYAERYKEDPRLPANPKACYREEWESFQIFLGIEKNPVYEKLEDAAKAAQSLGITSSTEYKRRRKDDPLLPAVPFQTYNSEWRSWYHFLGRPEPTFYTAYSEAKKAVRRLKIQSSLEYKRRHKEDPLLPSAPFETYNSEWQNWYHFLGKSEPTLYPTYSEAKMAARNLQIKSSLDYRRRHQEDPSLPYDPRKAYREDWKGWPSFLGKNKSYNRAA